MQLNAAMFDRNARCGYILKPKIMRFMKGGLSPSGTGKIKGVIRETLKISTRLRLCFCKVVDQHAAHLAHVRLFSGNSHHFRPAPGRHWCQVRQHPGGDLWHGRRLQSKTMDVSRRGSSSLSNVPGFPSWFSDSKTPAPCTCVLKSKKTKFRPSNKALWKEELVFEKVMPVFLPRYNRNR